MKIAHLRPLLLLAIVPALFSASPPALTLERSANLLVVRGAKLPGGSISINYLEAYCRANSTDADFPKQTKIPFKNEFISLSDDRSVMKLRDTLSDGLVVEHTITARDDEVDFHLVATNPTGKRSQAHWAQPCPYLHDFTGFNDPKSRNRDDYLPKCFVFLDGKLERMPTKDWATKGRYAGGQVWVPAGVPHSDVNPRPINPRTTSNGLIGCFSGDETMIWATAWEPYQELFQGVGRCLHSDFRLGGLKPGEKKVVRGKMYIVPNNVPALLARYAKDFTEHAPKVFKAGFAERDITPSIGMERAGGFIKQYHTAFHDPCKVRVAVFDDGRRKVALVGVDAVLMPPQVIIDARKEIARITDIDPNAVMIGASHSHSSGPTGIVQPGQYDGAPPNIQHLAYVESSAADPGYLMKMTHEIAQGVRLANEARVPAELGFGWGHEDQVAFNRRIRMRNGQTWTHPGAMNPDIVDYAGPIDPQVGVIGAWDKAGKLIGTVVHFSCHATTNPPGISANWPYFLERTIQGALDTRMPVVFLQGACGDITQVNNRSPFKPPAPAAWAHLVGGRVGAEAVKVLLSMPRGSDIPLDVRQKTIQLRRRSPTAARIAEARVLVAQGRPPGPRTPGEITDWTFAKETLMLQYLAQKEPVVDVEIQAIQIGPAVCVSNPAELFVEYGLQIKRESRFPFTFPVELANGYIGYTPTEEAFSPNGGGYETRLTADSNMEISAGRKIAEAGIEVANAMSPGPVPLFTPIDAPGKPWPYGNLPPQVE